MPNLTGQHSVVISTNSLEYTQKRWGTERVLVDDPSDKSKYSVKQITLNPDQFTSLHVHEFKREWLYVIQGSITISFENQGSIAVNQFQHVYLEPGTPHRMHNLDSSLAAVYLEVSQGGCHNDAERISL